MSQNVFEELRSCGYTPATMLDVGAHVGNFTTEFLSYFPNCSPTLIEPNPFCHEVLGKLPYEKLALAASNASGKGELFLTREWLQSTGSSLYRENTPYFRDDVVFKQDIDKARIDDILSDRRFNFVKIDTQGSELDVLIGGQEVLSRSDFILLEVSLVEYNIGGARAEDVFTQLRKMNFRCVDVTEFHRLSTVFDGNLLQLDFLFERIRGPLWKL